MVGYVTSSFLLKYQDDIAKAQGSEAARILEQIKLSAATGGNI